MSEHEPDHDVLDDGDHRAGRKYGAVATWVVIDLLFSSAVGLGMLLGYPIVVLLIPVLLASACATVVVSRRACLARGVWSGIGYLLIAVALAGYVASRGENDRNTFFAALGAILLYLVVAPLSTHFVVLRRPQDDGALRCRRCGRPLSGPAGDQCLNCGDDDYNRDAVDRLLKRFGGSKD